MDETLDVESQEQILAEQYAFSICGEDSSCVENVFEAIEAAFAAGAKVARLRSSPAVAHVRDGELAAVTFEGTTYVRPDLAQEQAKCGYDFGDEICGYAESHRIHNDGALDESGHPFTPQGAAQPKLELTNDDWIAARFWAKGAASADEATIRRVLLALLIEHDAAQDSAQPTAVTDERFKAHTEAVAGFLNELYAILVDPLMDGTLPVEQVKRELIEAAKANRAALEAALSTKAER